MKQEKSDFQSQLEQMSVQQLADLLAYHNRKYWQDNEPEISDDDYDLIVRALAAADPGHPLLNTVQAPAVSGTGKIVHSKPMLSLDKAYSLEELLEWGKKYCRTADEKLLVQPKYDGISALWSGGILATRGDGNEGENISDKIPLIELEHPAGIQPLADYRGDARGEIVIREDDFKTLYSRIRNRNGKTYKNSRNAVAGIMGLKDIQEMLLQKAKLTLVDYSLYSWTVTYGELKKHWQSLLNQVETLPYPMDGVVLKIADEQYGESLGNTVHHPRSAIAFKFSGVRRKSRLLAVEWSFGKNCLTPVAEIEAVDINGTTIRHASLHNLQNILDRDLQIGDELVVERAGDVIPYIVSSNPGTDRKSCLIESCPSCGSLLVQDLPELRCVNPECFETRLQHLLSAVRNIGIERLGEPNLRKIMKNLQVRSLKDLFQLKPDDLLRLEGYQKVSAENLYREIQHARVVPDWQILAALNIRGIGPNLAKGILSVCSLAELRQYSVEALSGLEQVGPERAAALWQELHGNQSALDELLSCVTVEESFRRDTENPSATICFTGKMPEKRSYYEQLAKQAGYEPVDSVNRSLSLLVAADPLEGNSSKLKKAAKLSIPVQSLEEWLRELGSITVPAFPLSNTGDLFELPEESNRDNEKKTSSSEKIMQGELF